MLTRKLLGLLMEPYRGADIDHGGMVGTLSRSEKDVEEIFIRTFGGVMPPRPKLPNDCKKWTPGQEELNDAYHEAKAGLFCSITNKYGWG